MSRGFSSLRCGAGGTILLLVLSAPKDLRAGAPATSDDRSIQFSAPVGNTLTTNYNQLGLPQTGVSSIEGNYPTADSAGAPRSSGSLAAVPVAPRVVVSSGGGAASLLDQQNSWAFATPDGLLRDYVATEILKLPQLGIGHRATGSGQVAGDFQRMSSEGSGGTTTADAMRAAVVDSFLGVQKPAANPDDNNRIEGAGRLSGADTLPSPFQSLTGSDRGLMGSLVPAAAQPTGISDLIGLGGGKYGPTAADAARVQQTQQSQLEEFKKLLGFQTQPIPGIAGALAAPLTQNPSSTPGMPGYPGATAPIPGQGNNPFNPLLGTVNPLPAAQSPATPSAPVAPASPGSSSFVQDAASAQAAKAAAPQPGFAPPRRAF